MRIGWRCHLAFGALMACGFSQVQAQHHYDHHDGGHYSAPPTYVYSAQPVVVAQPVQVQTVPAVQSVVAVQPVAVQPVAAAPALPAAAPVQPAANSLPTVRTASNVLPYRGRGVVLSNAEEVAVNYTLDNAHNYTMNPGQNQKLTTKGSWVITFNRGGDLGDVSYTLTEGSYQFQAGEQGWDIQRKADAATTTTSAAPPPPPSAPAANSLPPGARSASRSAMN